MKMLILGSGVIGVATAHYLADAGHEVTVIDRKPGPALETSFANAGEVSPGYSSPWAGPGIPLKAVKWLLMRYGPLVVRPAFDPWMWAWLFKMLRNCTSARYAVNKARMVPIAEYSRDRLRELRATAGIAYDERSQGTLQLFRTDKQLAGIGGDVEVLKQFGVPFEVLDPAGCIAAEPALAKVRGKFVGGLRLPGDETGDCKMFTEKLAAHAARARRDVSLRRDDRAAGRRRPVASAGVKTSEGMLTADAYVVALGSYSPILLRPARHFGAGLSDQGLFDHRADHRRWRRSGIDRHGRDLQGGDHPAWRPHPRRRHGRDLRLRSAACTRRGGRRWSIRSATSSPTAATFPGRVSGAG